MNKAGISVDSDDMKFIYCVITDGGMDKVAITLTDIELGEIPGVPAWMSKGCKAEDRALRTWARNSNVGDHYDHRMGTCFRVNA